MLIFVAYLGHPARSCVSPIENVNYSAEKRSICHWKHPHFATDSLFIGGVDEIFIILHFKGHSSCLI